MVVKICCWSESIVLDNGGCCWSEMSEVVTRVGHLRWLSKHVIDDDCRWSWSSAMAGGWSHWKH